jgi:aspartyl-tRNA(Asn)/glutamyl-tRNA(Gln) amidotransferase subunit C
MASIIDPKSIKKIASLARLSESPDQTFLDEYGQQLGKILDYVEELNEVDTSGIDPLGGNRIILFSELRPDTVNSDQVNYQKVRVNILNNFPNKQGDLLVVPGIFAST